MVSCSYLKFCEENQIQVQHFCVDLNQSALTLTDRIIKSSGYSFTPIHSRLFDSVNPEFKFDLIFFNPVKNH
jgi:methylase of polypeptide subunit release factors